MIQPLGNPFKTSIAIDVNIPESQQLRYIPGALETLKFAWIQYVSLLIPSMFIFLSIFGFIFRHQLVETSATSTLVRVKKH